MKSNALALVYATCLSFLSIFSADSTAICACYAVAAVVYFMLFIYFSHESATYAQLDYWLSEDYDNHSRVANIMISKYYFEYK